MKGKIKQRMLAILTAMILLVGFVPMTAFAENPDDGYTVTPLEEVNFAMLSGTGNYRFDFNIPDGASFNSLSVRYDNGDYETLNEGYLEDYTYYTNNNYLTLTHEFCTGLRDKGDPDRNGFTIYLKFTFNAPESDPPETHDVIWSHTFPATVAVTIDEVEGCMCWYGEYSLGDTFYVPKKTNVEIEGSSYGLYKFVGWQVGDQTVSGPTYNINTDTDLTIKALTKRVLLNDGLSPGQLDFGSIGESKSSNPPAAKEVTFKNNTDLQLQIVEIKSNNFKVEFSSEYENPILNGGNDITLRVQPKAGLPAGVYDEEIQLLGTASQAAMRMSGNELGEISDGDLPVLATIEAKYTVKEDGTVVIDKADNGTPDTGDRNNPLSWTLGLIAALGIIALTVGFRKRGADR